MPSPVKTPEASLRVRFESLDRETACRPGGTPFQSARRAPPRPGAGGARPCQGPPLTDLVLEVAPRSLASIVRAEVDGQGPDRVPPAPAVRVFEAVLTPPTPSRRR